MQWFLDHFQPLITPATIGIWGLIAGIFIWWIRGAPDRRRARTEADASLREDLFERITELERLRIEDRKRCQEEEDRLRERVRCLEEIIDALVDRFRALQFAVVRLVPPDKISPELERAFAALVQVLDSGEQEVKNNGEGEAQ